MKNQKDTEYYGAAEPLVRCGELRNNQGYAIL